MAVSYQNIAVSVGGATLVATSASVSFEVPLEGVRALGSPKAIATIPNGPEQGTLNISYILTSSDPINTIFNSIIASPSTYNGSSVSIGGIVNSAAFLTSHSLNGEPNSVINASATFTVFGPGGGPFGAGAAGAVLNENIGHGSASTLTIANAIGFDYSASLEFQPLYILGSSLPQAVTFAGGSQSMTLRGNNIARVVNACPTKETVTINVAALCNGGAINSVSITDGKLQSSESSVEAGGFVTSNFVINKNF